MKNIDNNQIEINNVMKKVRSIMAIVGMRNASMANFNRVIQDIENGNVSSRPGWYKGFDQRAMKVNAEVIRIWSMIDDAADDEAGQ